MTRGRSLNDAAILVRAQFQTREFEERFIAIGLPYQIVGGFRFYERAEIRDALAYLRLIHQRADDLAFERIVNQPKRGLGDKALATIHAAARATQQPLLLAAASMLDSDELQARAQLGSPASSPTSRAGGRCRTSSPHAEPRAHHARRKRLHRNAPGRAQRAPESAGRLENLAEPDARDGGI